jgi:hypothetical protein
MTAAKKLVRMEPRLESGEVSRVVGALEVRLPSGVHAARRAKSCLVAPDVGDRVLCAVDEDATYVVAVLEGREGAATKLVADGDLQVQARGGRVGLCGSEGVDIVTLGDVSVTAAEANLQAKKGSVAIEELGFVARLLRADVSKVAVLAREVDSVVTRLSLRAKRVFRFVEELDQTRAGAVDLRAENLLAMRSENTLITARVLAKVDGEQIHLG